MKRMLILGAIVTCAVARADGVCDQRVTHIVDGAGHVMASTVGDVGLTKRMALLRYLALIPSSPDYASWHTDAQSCLLDEGRCANEAIVVACPDGACPPGRKEYPLGGILLRRLYAETRAQNAALVGMAARLPDDARRAFPALVDPSRAYQEEVLAVQLGDPPEDFVSTDNQRFDCRTLHRELAHVEEVAGWGKVLGAALDPLMSETYEGFTVEETSKLKIALVRGTTSARVRIGDLYDSENTGTPDATGYIQTSLGAWPGGHLPIKLSVGRTPWAPDQWTVSGPSSLPQFAGYRVYTIEAALAPDLQLFVLSHDDTPPACTASAMLSLNFQLRVVVDQNDDFEPGTVSATVVGRTLPAQAGAHGVFQVPVEPTDTGPTTVEDGPVHGVRVDYACVDAAGNTTRGTIESQIEQAHHRVDIDLRVYHSCDDRGVDPSTGNCYDDEDP